jgi:hypothetical protein
MGNVEAEDHTGLEGKMPRRKGDNRGKAREIDPRLRRASRLVGELADEQCGPLASFWERSLAFRRILESIAPEPTGHEHDDESEDPEGRPH